MPKAKRGDKKKATGKADTTAAEQNHLNHTDEAATHTGPAIVATPAVLTPIHNNAQGEPQEAEDHEHDDITEESEKIARSKIKEKKHDAGAADLERITDFAQETEISASDISAVMGLIGEEVAGRLAKEKELLKVKIRKEDVELLVREFEISEERAERHLREHAGNIMETLQTLTT